MWGTPIALTFGLIGALLASLTTMILAAVGTWFGGWVDALIQRLTEINMVLPAFPLLVLTFSGGGTRAEALACGMKRCEAFS